MRLFTAAVALAVFATAAPLEAQVQIDVNSQSLLRDGFYKKNSSVGWYFTPSSSFFLSMVNTRFNTVGSNLNRTVTVELWSDRPAVGGTLISSAGFQSNTALGSFGGGAFAAPVLLQAGIQYFIGFRNIMGLGYNYTTDPFATSLGSMYFSLGPSFADDTWEKRLENDANPTMQLIGANVSSVPEPMTMTLLATGLGGLGLVGLIRRRRGGGTSR